MSNPAFSPDGKTLAFSANYNGNTDVFVVPVEGGAADAAHLASRAGSGPGLHAGREAGPLHFAPRGLHRPLHAALHGGQGRRRRDAAADPERGARGLFDRRPPDCLQPAGAGVPAVEALSRRAGVRRSASSTCRRKAVQKIAQPETRANDVDPMWVGDTLYFRSDRDGEFNLYAFDAKVAAVRQITRHADFPVLNATAGGGHIVYEQAGYLHLLDPATGKSRQLTFSVPSDQRETRERFVSGTKWIRTASLSPSGARAVFDFRGDIVTVPAEKGDVRNLTQTSGIHERSPVWSPDGTRIAYFSDKSGEYQLFVGAQDGKGEPRALTVEGHGFYADPVWSPDSQKISYIDNSQSIYWIDLQTGKSKKVASQQTYTPASLIHHAWSPDSKWLAYTIGTQPLVLSVSLYSVEQDKSFAITDGLAEVTEPVFDRSGKYLYFFGSTDAGPLLDWFAQSGNDMRETRNIYLAVLRKDLPSPLAKESDEEKESKGTDSTTRTKTRRQEADEPKPDTRRSRPDPICAARRRRDGQRRQQGGRFGAVPRRPRGHPVPDSGPADPGREPLEPAGRQRRADLFPPRGGRQDLAATVRPREAEGRDARAGRRRLPRVRGCQEASLQGQGLVVHRADDEGDQGRRRQDRRGLDRGEGRSARRVERGVRRGVAHQSRLFLRPGHARRGLEGGARQVRGASSRT